MEEGESADEEIKEETQTHSPSPSKDLKGKKFSWGKLRRFDSLDIEANAISNHHCRRQQAEDRDVSNYKLELPSVRQRLASKVKSALENSPSAEYFLLLITMLGTSMVIGDGVITPCISVLSAVGGIKEATSAMTEERIVRVSAAILVGLFLVQRFGTEKVGYSFAPILTIWFLFIGSIGLFNFFKHDPSVIKALYPKYIIDYFRRNKKDAWISLGGIILCTTGAEALFAHVGLLSIQTSTCCVVFPSIVLAYTGQAAYLSKHHLDAADAFYKSVPGPLYWPMFIVAILAAIVASQAMISASFSIIQQSPLTRMLSSNSSGICYVNNINIVGAVLIFVSIKSLPISKVLPDERFLLRLINLRELGVFRCVVRYGYTDLHEHESFERTLVDRLKEFIREELQLSHVKPNNKDVPDGGESDDGMAKDEEVNKEQENKREEAIKEKVELIEREYSAGIVHLLGKTEVVASKGSHFGRRILIDYAYNLLRRNIRERDEVLNIPHKRLLKKCPISETVLPLTVISLSHLSSLESGPVSPLGLQPSLFNLCNPLCSQFLQPSQPWINIIGYVPKSCYGKFYTEDSHVILKMESFADQPHCLRVAPKHPLLWTCRCPDFFPNFKAISAYCLSLLYLC
ncbi:hypothetical protein MRB53_029139 [Persea americana]|uniref:Uncharacterized protein n=1 Tax=Persea americana TaxID=3435 RepID=A0ACC2KHJ8_PERAE|nr:hypothetical protein MRB53_029139 [Persea americana]